MRSISRCLNSRSAPERRAEVGRGQQRLEPPADLVAQTLFAPGKLQRVRLQRAEPIRARYEQVAQRLGTAEERSENARLLRRSRLQRRAGTCGRKQVEEIVWPAAGPRSS